MERRHDLDWVRVCAFGLLLLYHVGMYYVSWDWHVKSPHAGTALEPFMLSSGPWRMSLLFLISGAATAFMLRRTPRRFLRLRSWRLLLPLLFGMAVVVPPQAYYQVVEQLPGGYREGYLAFYARYLGGYHGFCGADGDCLRLPTWNHLWFVAYLWVYTVLLWLGWRLLPEPVLARLRGWAGAALQGWRALLLPVALLAAARLLLVERFESTHALVDDWYNHAQYVPMFLIGVATATATGFWESLQRLRWPALLLAAACYGLMVHTWYFAGYSDAAPPPAALRMGLRVAWAVDQWCAIAALLGFAYRFRHADNRALRYLAPAVFPVYILHQTVIVVLAHQLKPWRLPPLLEGPLLVAATFALCFAGYDVVRRIDWLRPLFGLKHARGADAAALRSGASTA
ncbi:acyltransferase [Xanthomonas sp. AmX2]|uniref:acyltransferase family protein n=1 Tax=Xanthomonas sp. TaxID=29446 RepID=UPI001981D0BB|nr:acyltransferase [Xanthomonas sp.]MBN6151083.1 acyltransferase [Xanthomonas sp.]